MSYEELTERTAEAAESFGESSGRIKAVEAQMADNAALQKHIVGYIKTRDVYAAYKKSGYSKRFKAEHEADIMIHQTAKKAFDALEAKKLPSVKSLREQYAALLADKKRAYAKYREARESMRELMTVKSNVDSLFSSGVQQRGREEARG